LINFNGWVYSYQKYKKMSINKKKLNQVAKGLLTLKSVEHKRPKEPTKADLNRKFVMRLDKKGTPYIKEV